MKKVLLFIFFCGSAWSLCWSQTKTVSGTVKELPSMTPLPGVNVIIKGTAEGTVTDINGDYSLQVPNNDATLIFSFVGFENEEILVGDQTIINANLSSSLTELGEIVVTALGIAREEKSLTYAAQEVSGEELSTVKDANFINSLSGKAAGVFINRSSSGAGGSARVILRGNGSTGNNNVLYVIDGVPMVNSSPSQAVDILGQPAGRSGTAGSDLGDGISNINPSDIESISILRGASAAALYGSQAGNGVILITTKKGKPGTAKINFSSSITFEEPLLLPDIQNTYGRVGNRGLYSWSDTPLSTPAPDHLDDFFETGTTWINSISVSGGSEESQSYFSYANTESNGIMPNNELTRHNISFKETAALMDQKLKLSANINFINQEAQNRPVAGLYYNGLTGAYLFPRDADWNEFKNNFEVLDPVRNLSVQNWVVGPDAEDFFQNPYWITNRTQTFDRRNRVITTSSAGYQLADGIEVKLRGNLDKTFDEFRHEIHAGSSTALSNYNGRYILNTFETTQLYGEAMLGINKMYEEFSISAYVGSIIIDSKVETRYHDSFQAGSPIEGVNEIPGLNLANVFSLQNMSQPNAIHTQSLLHNRLNSVYASANLGYKGIAYLDLSVRQDWSSTLAFTDDDSFLYPAVGGSFIISQLVDVPFLDLLKIRASHAQVGNPLNALDTNPANPVNPNAGDLGNFSNVLVRPQPGRSLKPELNVSNEVGMQVILLEGRVELDVTYYNSTIEEQRVLIQAPAADGGGQYVINGGDIQNRGWEALLSMEPINNGQFSWTSSINFTRNVNEVKNISDEASNRFILTEAGSNGYASELREGRPFGLILGKKLEVNPDGTLAQDEGTGRPMVVQEGEADQFFELGNPNPDFQLGFTNTLSYKNFTLSFLFDGRFGGEVFSMTEAIMDQYGVSQRTADARDQQNFTVRGTSFDPQTYYTTVGGRAGVLDEYVYDATSIRLRELSLGYSLPPSIIDEVSFLSSARISVIGRNLFFIKNEAPFDPDISLATNNGLQGLDVFAMPATRSLGFNLSLGF